MGDKEETGRGGHTDLFLGLQSGLDAGFEPLAGHALFIVVGGKEDHHATGHHVAHVDQRTTQLLQLKHQSQQSAVGHEREQSVTGQKTEQSVVGQKRDHRDIGDNTFHRHVGQIAQLSSSN